MRVNRVRRVEEGRESVRVDTVRAVVPARKAWEKLDHVVVRVKGALRVRGRNTLNL